MNLRRSSILVLALLASALACPADELPGVTADASSGLAVPTPLAARSEANASVFFAETDVQLDLAFFGIYLAAEPHVVWRPGRLGLGVGVKLLGGATQFDLHAAPFARIEVGWFYANAGWVVQLLDRTERYQAVRGGLYTSTGIAPDLISLGYGRIGADLGLEWYMPVPTGEQAPVASLIRPWNLPYSLEQFLESILGTAFLRLGVLYTFPL